MGNQIRIIYYVHLFLKKNMFVEEIVNCVRSIIENGCA